MKKIRVEDAVGMELCHDVTAMYEGFKGAAFRRGHIIRQDYPNVRLGLHLIGKCHIQYPDLEDISRNHLLKV